MTELSKETISAKLDELKIDHDKRLGAEKLAELLPDEALAELTAPTSEEAEKTAEADEKTVEMRLRRDWWPAEGVRKRKGEIVTVTVEKAMDGMESGFLERVKG